MKLAIAAIVKDEIDSLAEWIAYHRVLGADHFLIADNKSQDGTREYLQSLEHNSEWLDVIDVATPPDRAPQLVAYEKLAALCPADVDLIAFIDADEYILPMAESDEALDSPRQYLHDWLNARFSDENINAVTMSWACFGSNGHRFRKEGLVIERFQKRAKKGFGPNHHYKSIVRRSALERMQNPHHPGLKGGEMRNADGRQFEYRLSKQGLPRRGLSEEICWQGVRLNHYIVKSVEEFVLKKARRGSAATVGYTKTSVYFERHDRNDEPCALAASLAPLVKAELERLELHVDIERRLAQEGALEGKLDLPFFSRKRAQGASPIRRLAVDYPSAEGESRTEAGQTLVQGWLFLTDSFADLNPEAKIVASWTSEFELKHGLTKERPDVVEHFGFDDPTDHPQLCCGFKFFLPLGVSRCKLELELGQQRWPLQKLKIHSADKTPQEWEKVYSGEDGWLFLRADTNMSLEQQCGALLLTDQGLSHWQDYFDTLATKTASRNITSRFLITPSKETVLEQAYGTPRAPFTAVDQILRLAPSDTLYPLAVLRELGDEAFYRTDTHWTHQAAMRTAIEFGVSIGLERQTLQELFHEDQYREVDHKGDLGGKLEPPVLKPVKVLKSFSNAKLKVYDNAIPNFGRLVVFENEYAPAEGTLLLCGASSSTALFNYLSRMFARVVFAHTAGNLDEVLLDAFTPDYLLMQTTARFAIRPPVATFSFQESLREKIAAADDAEFERIEKRRAVAMPPLDTASSEPVWQQWEELYQRLVQEHRPGG
ncbi:glycosyltransferase family 2 protein [Carnimonas nigrificans]|uniref:glycosyltransferase family 2 protein n=1 Tax=Carnimonas nigrificans TaxID=64323 RepID=UPI00046F0CDB|nr:glycosyltransferase family 2 protein [Carnimonas nigrificans]